MPDLESNLTNSNFRNEITSLLLEIMPMLGNNSTFNFIVDQNSVDLTVGHKKANSWQTATLHSL